MEKYRIIEGVGIYFVTFTVVEWLPVFLDEESCRILTDSLNYCIRNKSLRVNAYILMPNHLHAVLFDSEMDSARLARTLADFRKYTGRQLSDQCGRKLPAFYAEVLQRNASMDRERRFWQSTRHPEGIVTEKFWQQKVNYIHWNPVRKGLVKNPEDWRFSSASFWLDKERTNDVLLSDVTW